MGDQGGRRKKNNTEPRETSEHSKKENPNLHLVWLLIVLSLTTPNNERFVSSFTTLLQNCYPLCGAFEAGTVNSPSHPSDAFGNHVWRLA